MSLLILIHRTKTEDDDNNWCLYMLWKNIRKGYGDRIVGCI